MARFITKVNARKTLMIETYLIAGGMLKALKSNHQANIKKNKEPARYPTKCGEYLRVTDDAVLISRRLILIPFFTGVISLRILVVEITSFSPARPGVKGHPALMAC